MNIIQRDERDWIKLKVFRTFTKPVKVGQDEKGELYMDKVIKIANYTEWFLKDEIMKIEPNIYSKNKPPARNSCIIFYRPTNIFYKVKGGRNEIAEKLKAVEEESIKKAGFVYTKK